jgi:hypothetical protein
MLSNPAYALSMGSRGTAITEGTNKQAKAKKHGWLWPVGVMATGLAGAAVVAFRGCWHRKMSWPVRMQGHSYQVCLGCGAKRLFDEERFCAYGPFRYDLSELIAWSDAAKAESAPAPSRERPAS